MLSKWKYLYILAIGCQLWQLAVAGNRCNLQIPVERTRGYLDKCTKSVNGKFWRQNRVVTYDCFKIASYIEYETRQVCCAGYEGPNCDPICDPACTANSSCTHPGICQCNAGYTASHGSYGVCLPYCSRSCPEFSVCKAPEQCSCIAGYKPSEDASKCLPQCLQSCGDHGYCKLPNICDCLPGYELSAPDSQHCQPHCADGCQQHGECVAPNTCECKSGYELNDYGECVPVCKAPACGANSVCVAPQSCQCLPEYEPNALGNCVPVCNVSCPPHSVCSKPQVCECEQGYVMNEQGSECLPFCENECPTRSQCVAPDHCLCEKGYLLRDMEHFTRFCEPVCAENCSFHGKCVAPNQCQCAEGFEPAQRNSANDSFDCQPACSSGCAHGYCFAPEMCVCNAGYLMGPNSTCQPKCTLGCVNGNCIEPEICQCLPGYRLSQNSVSVCEPICETPCEFADCAAPNVCLCWDKYQPVELGENATFHKCMPSCEHECINANCSAPNNCSCHEGYQPSMLLSNECEPICEGCIYGKCLAPNECQCFEGYQKVPASPETDFQQCQGTEPSSSTSEPLLQELLSASTNAPNMASIAALDPCQQQCLCWQQYDELGSLSNAKCEPICSETLQQFCLNLSRCECNATAKHIECKASAEDDEDSSENGDFLNVYECKQHFYETADIIAANGNNFAHVFAKYWYGIVAAIVATLCALAFFIYRCSRQGTYRNDAAENDIIIMQCHD